MELLQAPTSNCLRVVASGGISNLTDIENLAALRSIGVEGAIVGKALYARAFTLEQALEVTRR